MDIKELYLKTVFCCMACDGDIADEEVAFAKEMADKEELFKGMDVEGILNGYIAQINEQGKGFLNNYIKEIGDSELSDEEQLQVLKIAVDTILADNKIEYNEIKFFKRIRAKMSVSDDDILPILPDPEQIDDIALRATCPDKEDFLLPDVRIDDEEWNVSFDNIHFEMPQEN